MSERFKSITQLNEMTGIDRRTLKKRLSSLKVHSQEGKAQLYDMYEAFQYLNGGAVMDNVSVMEQMKNEELRLETAKADKVELEVGKLRQSLVSIEDVASVVEREYGAVRAGFLSMPSKVAQDLVLLDDFTKIKNYLEDAVNEVLTELSADRDYADNQPPMADASPNDEASPNVITTNSETTKVETEDP